MAIKTQQYFNQLMALMPQGLLWDQLQEDPNFVGLFQSMAEEFATLDAREDDLINEADPRTTSEMLSDWERAYDLPDPCAGDVLTDQLRHFMLVAKVTNPGGQSKAFYISLAAALGYDITITEYKPYRVNSKVNDRMCGSAWRFVWQVNAPATTVTTFKVNSRVNEPLALWGNERLECSFHRLKPDHTIVKFSYGGQ